MNFKSLAKNAVMRNGGGALGGAAAVGVEMAVEKFLPGKVSPMMVGIGEILLGAIVPEISPKTKILEYAGAGMSGVGGANLTRLLLYPPKVSGTDEEISGIGADEELISGIGADEYPVDMNGVDDTIGASDDSTLGATDESAEVNGISFTAE